MIEQGVGLGQTFCKSNGINGLEIGDPKIRFLGPGASPLSRRSQRECSQAIPRLSFENKILDKISRNKFRNI